MELQRSGLRYQLFNGSVWLRFGNQGSGILGLRFGKHRSEKRSEERNMTDGAGFSFWRLGFRVLESDERNLSG
ncbi:hypothetical protein ACFX13_009695 [Malus domestica]